MRINADFNERVVVRTNEIAWIPSPMPGVERKMLDRIGGEVARATTVVRYAAGSRFSAHKHVGGEEFLVLEGIFSDETGDFPAGTYVRNPIGTTHAPYSADGCTILVKLQQFAVDDTERKIVDTHSAPMRPGSEPGVSLLPLHDFDGETAAVVRLQPGARFKRNAAHGGEEIFVLEGTVSDDLGAYSAGAWLRSPDGCAHTLTSGNGCLFWMKSGHLAGSLMA